MRAELEHMRSELAAAKGGQVIQARGGRFKRARGRFGRAGVYPGVYLRGRANPSCRRREVEL
eukprot:557326-Prorocentrum_minimum.AAC.1